MVRYSFCVPSLSAILGWVGISWLVLTSSPGAFGANAGGGGSPAGEDTVRARKAFREFPLNHAPIRSQTLKDMILAYEFGADATEAEVLSVSVSLSDTSEEPFCRSVRIDPYGSPSMVSGYYVCHVDYSVEPPQSDLDWHGSMEVVLRVDFEVDEPKAYEVIFLNFTGHF